MQFNAFAVYSAEVGVTAEVIPETQNSDYESGIGTAARIGDRL